MTIDSEASERRDPRTHALIGAAMEVHRVLGCGFLEAVYRHALARELESRNIAFVTEVQLPISYKGVVLDCGYRADFIVFDEVIVEIKAFGKLGSTEEAQVINYLKASGRAVGLLLNFGTIRLEFRRFVLTK